jgi:hypothetical protein
LNEVLKITKKKSKEKNLFNKKKKFLRQRTKGSFDFTKIDLNLFRPPNIWNYPLDKLKKLKFEKNEIIVNEIRDVDPSKCYVDGRIQKFLKIFEKLYDNMIVYWNTGKKADTWEYFYDKVLKALKINYISNKALKREEERKKKIEEEELKKKMEEEEENKKFQLTEIDDNIYNNESNLINNINNIKKEEMKKENKITSIKKIKIVKSKEEKILKNKIIIKEEGNTNETTN